jgi:hypothetical protein
MDDFQCDLIVSFCETYILSFIKRLDKGGYDSRLTTNICKTCITGEQHLIKIQKDEFVRSVWSDIRLIIHGGTRSRV